MTLKLLPSARLALFLSVAFLAASRPALSDDAKSEAPRLAGKLAAGQPVTIVCLGDSVTGVFYHTGGWRAYPEMLKFALEQVYPQAKIKVVNAGVNGNSTPPGLKRLQTDVLDHRPDLVTIMYGINDMLSVPLLDFQANLKEMITRCRDVHAEVLLCTPNAFTVDMPPRTTPLLETYCTAIKTVGRETNVPVCDCYGAYDRLRRRDPLAFRLLMSDFAHPNMDGHKLNAVTICKSLSGRVVSLDDVAPPQPAIPKTRARLKAGEPVRILAMEPYDDIVRQAFEAIAPQAKIELTVWPTSGQTLAQLEEASKTVRGRAPQLDFVVVAVPLAVTPKKTPPAEETIASYTWVLNWSLAFAYQEWDVIGITPGVLQEELSPEETNAEKFAQQLIRAQHLSMITRPAGDKSTATRLMEHWLRLQLAEK